MLFCNLAIDMIIAPKRAKDEVSCGSKFFKGYHAILELRHDMYEGYSQLHRLPWLLVFIGNKIICHYKQMNTLLAAEKLLFPHMPVNVHFFKKVDIADISILQSHYSYEKWKQHTSRKWQFVTFSIIIFSATRFDQSAAGAWKLPLVLHASRNVWSMCPWWEATRCLCQTFLFFSAFWMY